MSRWGRTVSSSSNIYNRPHLNRPIYNRHMPPPIPPMNAPRHQNLHGFNSRQLMQPAPNTNSFNEFPPLPRGGPPTVPSWTNSQHVYQANTNPSITNNYYFDRLGSPKKARHHSPTKMPRHGIHSSPLKVPPHQVKSIPNFTDQDSFSNTFVVFKGNVSGLSRETAIECRRRHVLHQYH